MESQNKDEVTKVIKDHEEDSSNHSNSDISNPKISIIESAGENGNADIVDEDEENLSPRKKSSVWNRIRKNIRFTEKGATPVNWKIVGLILISLFSSAFSLTFLFPFLPEMILFFGYEEADKGYYAGLVASAVFAGRAVGSYFWGWLSDKKGRRPVIIITVIGNGAFSVLFGFTQNLSMAIIARFLTGLANGTVGIAKTMLYEVSDDSNQAVSMSIIAMAWGSGIILGPAIGGLLASPAVKYPDVFDADGVFGQFPYLLPGMIVGVTCVIVAVIDVFLLPETMASRRLDQELAVGSKSQNDSDQKSINDPDEACNLANRSEHMSLTSLNQQKSGKISMSVEDLHCETEAAVYQVKVESNAGQESSDKVGTDSEDQEHHKLLAESDQRKDHLSVNSSDHDNDCVIEMKKKNGSVTKNGSLHSKEENVCMLQEEEEKKENGCFLIRKIKNSSLGKILSISDVREAVFMYTSFSFAAIGFDEIFTVWASTAIGLSGLGFDPARIGMVLGITAAPMLLLNFFVFPLLVRRFQLKNTFLGCSFISGLIITLIPLLHLVPVNDTVLLVLLLILLIPQKVANSVSFSATSLFVNNSAPPSISGAVNGIGMTCTAIARTIAPAVGGSVYAWSVGYGTENLGPPFDVSLSFFLFGVSVWLTVIYGIFTSESLNKQKKPAKKETK